LSEYDTGIIADAGVVVLSGRFANRPDGNY